MNDSLRDIYRQRVLAHSREPHNRRRQADANREVTGHNPLCGDKLTVYLRFDGDNVADVSFEGSGCAISVASASMMTDALLGQDRRDALALIAEVEQLFRDGDGLRNPRLEDMKALENVRAYPSRIKCATLPWRTVEAALQGDAEQVTTE